MTTGRTVAAACVMLVLVGACSAPAPVEGQWPEFRRGDALGVVIATAATEQLGAPYRYGGNTPDGFDCSGLAQYAYGRAGLRTPRTVADLRAAARPIELPSVSVGDLLFYRMDDGTKIDHVAIYVGDGRFVHAPSSGKTVSSGSVTDPYYSERFVEARRIR